MIPDRREELSAIWSIFCQLCRIMHIDLATGKILGAMESPGHWITATPTGEIFIGSLTGNVFRWYPGWLDKSAGSTEGLRPPN